MWKGQFRSPCVAASGVLTALLVGCGGGGGTGNSGPGPATAGAGTAGAGTAGGGMAGAGTAGTGSGGRNESGGNAGRGSLAGAGSVGGSSGTTLCGSPIGGVPPAAPNNIPAIIVDTDMGPDCDDAGALAILHAMADQGEATILGVLISTSNGSGSPGVGFTDALNTYYGRPNIPIGLWRGPQFLYNTSYTAAVDDDPQKYPHDMESNAAPDATCLYRALLASQPDNSVSIVSIGPMNNLARLLESPAAADSPLNGSELVAKKVKQLVQMGGEYPGGREFNFYSQPDDRTTTRAAIGAWPSSVPIVFSGYEVGAAIVSGASLANVPSDSPVQLAYRLYTGGLGSTRPSWDLTAVLYAVRGLSTHWQLHTGGSNNIAQDGSNQWQDSPTLNQSYLIKKAESSSITAELDGLMARPPSVKP